MGKLHKACREGDIDRIRKYIKAGVDLNEIISIESPEYKTDIGECSPFGLYIHHVYGCLWDDSDVNLPFIQELFNAGARPAPGEKNIDDLLNHTLCFYSASNDNQERINKDIVSFLIFLKENFSELGLMEFTRQDISDIGDSVVDPQAFIDKQVTTDEIYLFLYFLYRPCEITIALKMFKRIKDKNENKIQELLGGLDELLNAGELLKHQEALWDIVESIPVDSHAKYKVRISLSLARRDFDAARQLYMQQLEYGLTVNFDLNSIPFDSWLSLCTPNSIEYIVVNLFKSLRSGILWNLNQAQDQIANARAMGLFPNNPTRLVDDFYLLYDDVTSKLISAQQFAKPLLLMANFILSMYDKKEERLPTLWKDELDEIGVCDTFIEKRNKLIEITDTMNTLKTMILVDDPVLMIALNKKIKRQEAEIVELKKKVEGLETHGLYAGGQKRAREEAAVAGERPTKIQKTIKDFFKRI